MRTPRRAVAWLSCLFLVAAVGCTKKVSVRGQVTNGSTPLKGTELQPVTVRFTRLDDSKKVQVYDAVVNQEDGTFAVELLTGKYQVSVRHFNESLEDEFEGAFAEGASPIVREIRGNEPINIDLKAEGGARKSPAGPDGNGIPEHPQ